MVNARRFLAVPIALAALVVGCGDDESEGGTFDREEFPFTFSYPAGFEVTDEVSLQQTLGAEADETAAVGLDEDDVLIVQSFTLNVAIDESNLELAKREIDGLIQQVDPAADSSKTEVAGLPALELDGVPVPSVEDAESRLNVIFDGDQEYFLNCQSTSENRDEIAEACDLALATFALK